MSKPDWMYSSGGEGFGPFTEGQLKKLISAGLVRPTDRVWKNGNTESQSVASFIEPPPFPKRIQTSVPSKRKGVWLGSLLIGCLALSLGAISELGLLFRGLPAIADAASVDAEAKVNDAGESTSTAHSEPMESLEKSESSGSDSHPVTESRSVGTVTATVDNESHNLNSSVSTPTDPWPEDALEFKSSRYKFYKENLSWVQAKERCENMQGALVTIQSLGENEWVKALVLDAGWDESWLGATDEAHEGSWKWVTGAPVDFGYTNWFPKQPNNKRGVEHYMVMWAVRGGQWVDQPIRSHQHKPGFVCEWGIGKGGN